MPSWIRGSAIGRAARTSTAGVSDAAIAGPLASREDAGSRPWYWDVWVQMVRRKPLGTVGAAIVVVMLAAAVLADVLTPYGFAETNLRERFIAMDRAFVPTDDAFFLRVADDGMQDRGIHAGDLVLVNPSARAKEMPLGSDTSELSGALSRAAAVTPPTTIGPRPPTERRSLKSKSGGPAPVNGSSREMRRIEKVASTEPRISAPPESTSSTGGIGRPVKEKERTHGAAGTRSGSPGSDVKASTSALACRMRNTAAPAAPPGSTPE